MKELNAKDVKGFVDKDNPIILEIGCNDGTDTLEFLKEMPEARIHCFEPDPRAIDRFYKTVVDGRVTLEHVAIANMDGVSTFYGSSGRPSEKSRKSPKASHYCFLDEWDLSGSLCKPTGHLQYSPWTTFPENRQYQVKTMRLDTWRDEWLDIDCIDFIWCDVQGAEALVIEGAPETLAITQYFYTEFYDKPLYEGQKNLQELHDLLPDFSLVGTFDDNALFKNQRI